MADAFHNRITLFDANGVALAAWELGGSAPGRLFRPTGMAVDAGGDLYVADGGNHRIQRFTRSGVFVEALGDSGSGPGQFRTPGGLALTPDRQLYVADHDNARVQHFDWQESPPRFVAILGDSATHLVSPNDVAVDSLGFVYVTDLRGNEIVQFDAAGNEVRRFHGAGLPPDELPAPLGVLVDGATLHVTDVLNGFVEAFDASGLRLYAWPTEIPGPGRMALGGGRRLFVGSGQDRSIYVFLRPVPVREHSWSDVKERFR